MPDASHDSEFFQDGPELGNQWEDDVILRRTLERLIPTKVFQELNPGLRGLGKRAAGDIARLGDEAEANPPQLTRYDPWGRRIDRIEVSDAWKRLHAISAEEGLVAIPYEQKHGAHSRLCQFAKIHLFHPSSAFATCPLAMTDGAAKVLSLYADEATRDRLLPRLTSRNPEAFWTSGQWMTERAGGSDVSRTGTVAKPEGDGFRLYGTKWFTSATTSEMALTLARIEGDPEKSRGLSLFLVETKDEEGNLRNIRVLRLKDKLGTRALPTAELKLDGTPATLIGERGRGIATIASMLNITRLWNAASSVAMMRRGLALATDYANRRETFGKPLIEHPLHRATLDDLQAEYEAAFQLVAQCFLLLGKTECDEASDEEQASLRLLTPLAKLWTGKLAVAHASEVLESFGGAGYIENTGLPRLLRDAQVLSIWEGTTNVLSLDVQRVLARSDAFDVLIADLRQRIEQVKEGQEAFQESAGQLEATLDDLTDWHTTTEGNRRETEARDFALSLAKAAAGTFLIEQAIWEKQHKEDEQAGDMARRFVSQTLQYTENTPQKTFIQS